MEKVGNWSLKLPFLFPSIDVTREVVVKFSRKSQIIADQKLIEENCSREKFTFSLHTQILFCFTLSLNIFINRVTNVYVKSKQTVQCTFTWERNILIEI